MKIYQKAILKLKYIKNINHEPVALLDWDETEQIYLNAISIDMCLDFLPWIFFLQENSQNIQGVTLVT